LNDLSEKYKKTAPPRSAPFFALVNPKTGNPRIVLNTCNFMGIDVGHINKNFFERFPIGDILKHEHIHTIQQSKRKNINRSLPDPNNLKSYFSNKDEVMAFSFSVAKELFDMFPNIKNEKELFKSVNKVMLYNSIKRNVDDKILKRYNKYIFLYLEKLINS
jgi:hypothetical protein